MRYDGWDQSPATIGYASYNHDGWMCIKQTQSTNPQVGSFITYRDNNLRYGEGSSDPCYNRLIGNTTSYSRHLYGGAVDIFVDPDKDGWVDDLNADGKVNREHARVLASWVESLAKGRAYAPLVGGLATYGSRSERRPFVHMDVRGKRARW